MTWSNQAPDTITIPPGATKNYIKIDETGIHGFDSNGVEVLTIRGDYSFGGGTIAPAIQVGNPSLKQPYILMSSENNTAAVFWEYNTTTTASWSPAAVVVGLQNQNAVNEQVVIELYAPVNNNDPASDAQMGLIVVSEAADGSAPGYVWLGQNIIYYPAHKGTAPLFQVGNNAPTKMSLGNTADKIWHYYEELTCVGQNIPNVVGTIVHWQFPALVSQCDSGSSPWDQTTFKWTCPLTGVYHFDCALEFTAWAANQADMSINYWINGTRGPSYDSVMGSGHGFVSMTRHFVAGDVVWVQTFQNTGATQTLSTDTRKCYVSVHAVK